MELKWRVTGDGWNILHGDSRMVAFVIPQDACRWAYVDGEGSMYEGPGLDSLEDTKRYVETLVKLEWA